MQIKTEIERLRLSVDVNVRSEISFWLNREINDVWEDLPIQNLVTLYWAKAESEDGFEREDLHDGLHSEADYFVWQILDQVFYKFKIEMNCERVLATITTTGLIKLVLQQKCLI